MGAWGRLIPCQGCPLVFYSHLRSELTKKTRAVGKHFTLKIHLKKAYHLHLTDEETERQYHTSAGSGAPRCQLLSGHQQCAGKWALDPEELPGCENTQGSESQPLGEKPTQPHSVGGMGLEACPGPQGRTEPLSLSCQHSHECAHTGHQVGSREHLLCEQTALTARRPWGPVSVGTEHHADVPRASSQPSQQPRTPGNSWPRKLLQQADPRLQALTPGWRASGAWLVCRVWRFQEHKLLE